MVYVIIDKGIQTLMMKWISYVNNKVLLYGTPEYSVNAQTVLQFDLVRNLKVILKYISWGIPNLNGGI